MAKVQVVNQGAEMPKEALEALGLITVNFAYLELSIKIGIRTLLAVTDDSIGHILTAELSFRRLLSLLNSLGTYRLQTDDAMLIQLKELIECANEVADKRNRIIHSLWFPPVRGSDRDQFSRLKVTARGKRGLDRSLEQYTPQKLHEIANSIQKCNVGFHEFNYKAASKFVFRDS